MNHCCLLYSTLGVTILQNIYNIKAEVKVGSAAFLIGIDDENVREVYCIGGLDDDNELICAKNEFHCWIESDRWLIDFMAPSFAAIQSQRFDRHYDPLMIQKKLNLASNSIYDMTRPGDYNLIYDAKLRLDLLKKMAIPFYHDLCNICIQWYEKPPKKMNKIMTCMNEKCCIEKIRLQGVSVNKVF